MARAATAERIEQLLKDYRNRGEMTRRAFCESRGMSSSMLDYYLRRYGRGAKREPARLVRVNVEQAHASGTFAVVLANGRRIESPWTFSDAELSRLIRIAENA